MPLTSRSRSRNGSVGVRWKPSTTPSACQVAISSARSTGPPRYSGPRSVCRGPPPPWPGSAACSPSPRSTSRLARTRSSSGSRPNPAAWARSSSRAAAVCSALTASTRTTSAYRAAVCRAAASVASATRTGWCCGGRGPAAGPLPERAASRKSTGRGGCRSPGRPVGTSRGPASSPGRPPTTLPRRRLHRPPATARRPGTAVPPHGRGRAEPGAGCREGGTRPRWSTCRAASRPGPG